MQLLMPLLLYICEKTLSFFVWKGNAGEIINQQSLSSQRNRPSIMNTTCYPTIIQIQTLIFFPNERSIF